MQRTASVANSSIPDRARTLGLLCLMGRHAPIMYLRGAPDGFGDRWVIQGALVEPAIACWLVEAGYIADRGATELGARRLELTAAGIEFRAAGVRWWRSLSLLVKLRVMVFG
jgi:hypothetical protein